MDGRDDEGLNRPDLEVLFAAVQASGEAILITSADLDEPGPRIDYVNPVFTRMTGYTAREIRGVTERCAAEDRRGLMVRELHHRVKNTLATVQAVLNATVRSSPSISEFICAFSGRIASLAKTHALITEDDDQTVSFEGLLRAELCPYEERGSP